MALALSGCYYAQAIKGHVSLMSKRESIATLLENQNLDPNRREQLILAREIRAFATSELLLPDNRSYTTFVDLQGNPPVWIVVAAPEFSTRPKTWCYLLVGCLSYRGYFKADAAQAHAADLARQGLDVGVVPGGAYSTLGWFSDPLLSTMLDRGETELASFIFHELAHQVVFVKGDTAFNESFATAVERIGLQRWLRDRSALLSERRQQQAIDRRITDVMLDARRDLEGVYQSGLGEADMRTQKAARLATLRREIETLAPGRSRAQTYNNATLSLVAVYVDGVAAFDALYRDCDGGLECFYQAVQERANWSAPARAGWLEKHD